MTTLFEALRESHDIQRSLCRSMTSARAAGPKRRQAYLDLAVELAAHAAAEERYLYAPILMDDGGLDSSRHALAEHHDMDELVEDLRGVDGDSDEFANGAKALAAKVRHHLKEEETAFFQVAGRILSDTRKDQLRRQYVKDYERMKVKLGA